MALKGIDSRRRKFETYSVLSSTSTSLSGRSVTNANSEVIVQNAMKVDRSHGAVHANSPTATIHSPGMKTFRANVKPDDNTFLWLSVPVAVVIRLSVVRRHACVGLVYCHSDRIPASKRES